MESVTNQIDDAFTAFPRELFLPEDMRDKAGRDMPMLIGYGQTNSQPSTVRKMLQWLDVRPGDRVLDVGAGSGWTAALLSFLTGEKGRVVAVEKVPELVRFSKENCQRTSVANASFYRAGEVLGWPGDAPYERILVSAAADELPEELISQLKEGGRMVIPVKNSILVVNKRNGNIRTAAHPGFAFVPLLSDKS